jgi:D-alanyl-D-alanine carboxypeptidase
MPNRRTFSTSSTKRLRTVFLLLAVWLFACSTAPRETLSPAEPSQPTAANNTLPPNSVDTTLADKIDHLIDDSDLALARWGVSVIALKDNRRVYERNADKLFTPASNMKLFPTGVALELLGPDYRWRTSVYASSTEISFSMGAVRLTWSLSLMKMIRTAPLSSNSQTIFTTAAYVAFAATLSAMPVISVADR